jgi:hypothetical protein
MQAVAFDVTHFVVGILIPDRRAQAPVDGHADDDDLGVRCAREHGETVLTADKQVAVLDGVVGLIEAQLIYEIDAPVQGIRGFCDSVRFADDVLADHRYT